MPSPIDLPEFFARVYDSTNRALRIVGNATAAGLTAFTQTYATASHTHANLTSAAVDATGALNVGILYAYGSAAQADAIPAAINALRTDVLNVKQTLNAVIDDLQAEGWLR